MSAQFGYDRVTIRQAAIISQPTSIKLRCGVLICRGNAPRATTAYKMATAAGDPYTAYLLGRGRGRNWAEVVGARSGMRGSTSLDAWEWRNGAFGGGAGRIAHGASGAPCRQMAELTDCFLRVQSAGGDPLSSRPSRRPRSRRLRSRSRLSPTSEFQSLTRSGVEFRKGGGIPGERLWARLSPGPGSRRLMQSGTGCRRNCQDDCCSGVGSAPVDDVDDNW